MAHIKYFTWLKKHYPKDSARFDRMPVGSNFYTESQEFVRKKLSEITGIKILSGGDGYTFHYHEYYGSPHNRGYEYPDKLIKYVRSLMGKKIVSRIAKKSRTARRNPVPPKPIYVPYSEVAKRQRVAGKLITDVKVISPRGVEIVATGPEQGVVKLRRARGLAVELLPNPATKIKAIKQIHRLKIKPLGYKAGYKVETPDKRVLEEFRLYKDAVKFAQETYDFIKTKHNPAKHKTLWMRIGDRGKYEKFTSLQSAARKLAPLALRHYPAPLSIHWHKEYGLEISPSFTGRNYISLFWGDQNAQPTRTLNGRERMLFIDYMRNWAEKVIKMNPITIEEVSLAVKLKKAVGKYPSSASYTIINTWYGKIRKWFTSQGITDQSKIGTVLELVKKSDKELKRLIYK